MYAEGVHPSSPSLCADAKVTSRDAQVTQAGAAACLPSTFFRYADASGTVSFAAVAGTGCTTSLMGM